MAFSGQPNDKNVQIAIRQGQRPVWAHPERVYWHFEWLQIRDAESGEIQWRSVVSTFLTGMGFKARHTNAVMQRLMSDEPGRWRQALQ